MDVFSKTSGVVIVLLLKIIFINEKKNKITYLD